MTDTPAKTVQRCDDLSEILRRADGGIRLLWNSASPEMRERLNALRILDIAFDDLADEITCFADVIQAEVDAGEGLHAA